MLLMKRIKTEHSQMGAGDATPNKSLNASFSQQNVFASGIYGLNRSRINLSNFLLDQRNQSTIYGGINQFAAAAAAFMQREQSNKEDLPCLSKVQSLMPDPGFQAGIMDMNELFNELDMGQPD